MTINVIFLTIGLVVVVFVGLALYARHIRKLMIKENKKRHKL